MWRLNNMLLNNQWVTEKKSRRKSKNTWRQVKIETKIQNLWDRAKAVLKGKFFSDTGLPQETKTISNKKE